MSASNTEITAEQVAQFLRANPEFFAGREELLADLRLPAGDSGAAVSLIDRQLGVLRERNVELRERLNSLLSIARDNDIIFEKTRALLLAMLECRDVAALNAALSRSLLEDFGMAAFSLTLFDGCGVAAQAPVRTVEAGQAEASVGGLVKGSRVVCGVLRPEELRFVFADGADAVGSAAIVPLVFDGQFGLLSIGSRDPHHFKSGMDTLFVGHIGDVLARCLHALRSGGAVERARAGG